MPNLITYSHALIKLGYRTVGNLCKAQVPVVHGGSKKLLGPLFIAYYAVECL